MNSPLPQSDNVAAMGGAQKSHRPPFRLFRYLSTQEKINFTRHLAIVIKAGMPVYEALRILRKQTTSKTLLEILDTLLVDVNNGHFLADSLSKYREIFGDFYINIIWVGESSGTLSQNLVYLAEELKKSKAVKNKIRAAMVYPVIILVATIIVTSFLTFFVFPKILPLFLSLNVKLPPTTQALIGFLTFSKTYGIYTVVGLILFIVLSRLTLKKVPMVKYAVDWMLLYVPVLSTLIISLNLTNFCRVLGLLLKSGMRIVEAIMVTSSTFTNSVYRSSFIAANEQIKKGGQMADFMADHRKLFPPILTEMIEVGESTGNLEDNLLYLSEYYTEEVDNQLRNFTSLLEPLLILMMGLFVGFVAVSIILPIYSLSQGLSQ